MRLCGHTTNELHLAEHNQGHEHAEVDDQEHEWDLRGPEHEEVDKQGHEHEEVDTADRITSNLAQILNDMDTEIQHLIDTEGRHLMVAQHVIETCQFLRGNMHIIAELCDITVSFPEDEQSSFPDNDEDIRES